MNLFYASDLASQYLPWYYLASQYLKSHQLPHWIADIYNGGYPLLAEGETGVLSPVNASLLFFFPFPIALNLLYIIHAIIAVTGVYLFLRNNKLGYISSLLGGLTFVLSGFFISRYFQPAIIFSAAFLPWGMLIVAKAQKSINFLFWLAPLIFLQITAGHLQIALISILAYWTYALFLTSFEKKNLLFFARVITVILLGVGLSLVQLLPSLKLYDLSERTTWDRELLFTYSLPPSHLVTYLAPNFFGVSAPGDDLGFTQKGGGFWELNLTIWTFPFLLSLFATTALAQKQKRQIIIILYLLWTGFLLLSFGGYFRPYWLVAHIPDFPFRAPSRFLLVATFAASALAAFGFEKLTKNFPKFIKITIFLIILISVLLQIRSQLKDYFLIRSSPAVINNLSQINKISLTTPLPLKPDSKIKQPYQLFARQFQKGAAFSLVSLLVLVSWWRLSVFRQISNLVKQ